MLSSGSDKTKVLVFGGTGMLGHKLWQIFSDRFNTYVTVRQKFDAYTQYGLFDRAMTLTRVSVQDFDSVVRAISKVRPTVVINCIGIVKQKIQNASPLISILVNALFPHRLAQLCRASNSRLIQISTDCVFSGSEGNYVESDVADAKDIYGKTKFLGETSCEGCLTLRTSIVGRELATSHGLMEWFLSQEGKVVKGYKRAIFSGFPTIIFADIIAQVITEHPGMEGVWHVASQPISKLDLLSLVKQVYGLDIHIEPDEEVMVDRSLNGDRFRKETGFDPLAWPEMIERMYQDPTPYTEVRRTYANG